MNENQKNQEVIDEFRKRRNRQFIVPILVIGFIVFFILLEEKIVSLWGIPSQMFSGVFIALIIGVLIFSLKNWRCPACNGYLGKGSNPRFCQKCGVQLRD